MQYLFIESLDGEATQGYLDKISSFDEAKELTIILDTNGGSSYIREIILRAIKNFTISIDVYCAFSNGMIILDRLSRTTKNIYINDAAQFMVHLCGLSVDIGDGGKVARGGYDKYKKRLQEEYNPYEFGILTAKEREQYLNGEDVYISPKRIKEYYCI